MYHQIVILLSLLAGAVNFSLNGSWEISMGDSGADAPASYTSTCPVPGIASQSSPSIADDLHHCASEVPYDYIWYRRTFTLDTEASQAFLMLRARYNAKVWVNGKEVGYDDACAYSHSRFDVHNALNFKGENEIVVRVGSWNTASFPSKENKSEWWRTSRCPGLIDNVWIELSGEVSADRLEVLPDVEGGKVCLRATLTSTRNCVVKPVFVVRDSSGKEVLRAESGRWKLRSGKPLSLSQEADAGCLQTWSAGPDGKPVLYTACLLLGEDVLKTVRFGYRDVRIKGRDVLLNGEKIHFAAENIAFARTLITWADCVMNPGWVRNFLRTVIHDYGFNFLRMHLGHAPSFWYDIADEEGILIQDEWGFMHEKDPQGENLAQTEKEFTAWVKENINHPSIIGWDMENEGDVDLFELSARLREYDPTRMWPEDDFDTQHRYEYSENIVPVPYCEPSAQKPTTVLESCRLWVNQCGQLEPRESFKTSRTASSWGVYYYTSDILEQLQADIHADQGTYFRSIEVQAWAPFALLSGTVNGHNFFRGDIGKSLEPQKNLEVLKSFNGKLGASFLMLQAREWYKDRVSYAPGSTFSKPVVVWNDNSADKALEVCVTLENGAGECVGSDSFKLTVPPHKALTLNDGFSLCLPSDAGFYSLKIKISDGTSSFEGPSRRLAVGLRPQDLSLPFDGAVCVLDHFLPGIPETLKSKIIERTFQNPIDQISKEGRVVKYTVYEKDSAKTFKMSLDPDGNVLSLDLVKDKSTGWLKHAF